MYKYGFLYVTDRDTNAVRKWKIPEQIGTEGEVVAGGNGQGENFNQLS